MVEGSKNIFYGGINAYRETELYRLLCEIMEGSESTEVWKVVASWKKERERRKTMDKIKIKDLEVYANHGVFPEETKLGQKFLVSADLYTCGTKSRMYR